MNKGIPSPYQDKELDVITDEGYGRFSKADIVALRTFKDNALLLKILKKIFFQMDLTTEETHIAESQFKGNEVLYKAIEKVFVPTGEDITLMGGTRWSDRKYAELLAAEAKIIVLARKDSIEFMQLGMKRLNNIVFGGDFKKLELVIDINMENVYDETPPEQVKRKVVAFQDSMIFIDTQFAVINGLINKKEETELEREARLKKDSTK